MRRDRVARPPRIMRHIALGCTHVCCQRRVSDVAFDVVSEVAPLEAVASCFFDVFIHECMHQSAWEGAM